MADLIAFTIGSVNERGRAKHGEQAYAVSRIRGLPARRQKVMNYTPVEIQRQLRSVPDEISTKWNEARLKGRTQKKR
jgi:hypothetical protein